MDDGANLLSLPEPLMERILMYADEVDLCSVTVTCQALRAIARSEGVWEACCLRKLKEVRSKACTGHDLLVRTPDGVQRKRGVSWRRLARHLHTYHSNFHKVWGYLVQSATFNNSHYSCHVQQGRSVRIVLTGQVFNSVRGPFAVAQLIVGIERVLADGKRAVLQLEPLHESVPGVFPGRAVAASVDTMALQRPGLYAVSLFHALYYCMTDALQNYSSSDDYVIGFIHVHAA